ncbi:MAG: 5'-methylthioadenosine/adenosylhomocysteine nucleosidase, partial [Prevotella sp.]|nr:5'-methylthioadenosine/adenosylhomocysteine nucleosidase [Prevotella sp.]
LLCRIKRRPMKIGIIVAMDRELRLLLRLLPCKRETDGEGGEYYCQTIDGGRELVITRSGIGKVNSALVATQLMRRYCPDCIISTGVAGGASDDVEPLDVVASSATVYHDADCGSGCQYGQIQGLPAVFEADKRLVAVAEATPGVRSGLIATGDKFISKRADVLQILTHFPSAVAVDMESCSIAQACFLRSCPFISFRVISDNPLKDRSGRQYDNFWERVSENSFRALTDFLKRL